MNIYLFKFANQTVVSHQQNFVQNTSNKNNSNTRVFFCTKIKIKSYSGWWYWRFHWTNYNKITWYFCAYTADESWRPWRRFWYTTGILRSTVLGKGKIKFFNLGKVWCLQFGPLFDFLVLEQKKYFFFKLSTAPL